MTKRETKEKVREGCEIQLQCGQSVLFCLHCSRMMHRHCHMLRSNAVTSQSLSLCKHINMSL